MERRDLFGALILTAAYILLANARSVQENPFIPGANLAVYMIVPVIAGILFGRWMGLSVGFLGTLINAIIYVLFARESASYEVAAILPHAIMGYFSGYLGGRVPNAIAALSIIVGHLLNIIVFIIFGLMPLSPILGVAFWIGLAYETVIGVLAIVIITAIYRMGVEQ